MLDSSEDPDRYGESTVPLIGFNLKEKMNKKLVLGLMRKDYVL